MLTIIRLSSITLLCTFVLLFFSIQPCSASEERETSEIEQGTVFYYTVKKGDTLWDISQHFFDSPWLGPELWSKNNQILNPHLIYPGNRIRIYKKDGVIMITQVTEEEPGAAVETVKEEAPVEVRAPFIPPAPSVEVKEEKLKTEAPVFVDKKPEKELPFFQYTNIDRIGFIREKPAEAYAYIFKMKDDKQMVSNDDIVYLKQKKNSPHTLIPGSLYLIFEILEDPIKDNISKDYIGLQHMIKGVVEITEILQKNPLIAEGRVTSTFLKINIGNFLLPYNRRSPKIPLTKSPEGIDGKILVTRSHRMIIASDTIAFIDKGEQDGIQPGQRFSIYYTEDLDEITKKIDIGSLMVLHTEKTTSTVLITDADEALEPGFKIRTPLR